MKLTVIYKENTDIEDMSKDNYVLKMNRDEWNNLNATILYAFMVTQNNALKESTHEIIKKLKMANQKRKVVWR